MKKLFLLIMPFLLTACGPPLVFGIPQGQGDMLTASQRCDVIADYNQQSLQVEPKKETQPQQPIQPPQIKPSYIPDDPHHHFIPGHSLPDAGFPEQRISPRNPVY